MSDNLFSANTTTQGFRLDFFQLYNWGLFDGEIYTVDARNKSTLLTGENGSGKTTLVDAIMTLLVPQNMRFYNQSSGSNKKHDRSEESYVLGAYGNKQESENAVAKVQTLRDSTAFSVLAGCFVNETTGEIVSLLQVRYFTGDTLQRIFAVTRKRLSIQDINEALVRKNISIDRTPTWRKVLQQEFGTVFFGDNFKKYSESYSQIFGFRSDKALRLFSQIVGLKVLGNLTEFIRMNMLEEQDTLTRYEQLRSSYQNLMQSNREIQKAKAQIELLEPIKENGDKWRSKAREKQHFFNMRQYVPSWYTKCAREIVSDELENIRDTLQHTISNREEEQSVNEGIQGEIDTIKISIAQNAASQRLNQIREKIESITNEKKHIEEEKFKYNEKLSALGIEAPMTSDGFDVVKKTLKSLLQKEQAKKSSADKIRIEAYSDEKEEKKQIDAITKELESLGSRPASNIPLENIEIRATICDALEISERKLPFAGELLRVAGGEEKWSYAIERLMHNFALTLLVTPDIYEDVTDYVKNNNMRGRVVYLKTDDDFYLADDFDSDRDTVPGKMEVRDEHPLSKWIRSYVKSHFDFLCTDDTNEIARARQAISSTGLIKKGSKHEKDDREHIRNSSIQVLGWDNSSKRRELSARLDELKSEAEKRQRAREQSDAETEQIEERIRLLKNASEISSWSQIDTESFDVEIISLEEEQNRLSNSDENMKELQGQLKAVLDKKKASDERINTFTGIIAVLQDKQKGKEEKLSQYTQTWQVLKDGLESVEGKETEEAFEREYQVFLDATSIDALDQNNATITEDLDKKIEECTKKETELSQLLIKQMSNVKNPNQSLREKFGDWSDEFINMEAAVEYIDDFISVYDRLLKDNLPHYQEQFNEYLHETMNNDIVDFYEFIADKAQDIRTAIENLNSSLKSITYEQTPETFLQLIARDSSDIRIKEMRAKLNAALPERDKLEDEEYQQEMFEKVKDLLDYLDSSDANRKFVLDIRNWFSFAASENYSFDKSQKQYYSDSASLSGGEKAKLTYTILASAIAYQFGINNGKGSSFRFVIVDEAFSKSDSYNSEYAMRLFKQIDLQLMVVTPLDKINIVEDYISSVHLTENKNTHNSRLIGMSIETYKEKQQE